MAVEHKSAVSGNCSHVRTCERAGVRMDSLYVNENVFRRNCPHFSSIHVWTGTDLISFLLSFAHTFIVKARSQHSVLNHCAFRLVHKLIEGL